MAYFSLIQLNGELALEIPIIVIMIIICFMLAGNNGALKGDTSTSTG